MEKILVFGAAIIISLITVFADALIKRASNKDLASNIHLLVVGILFYSLTAIGWFFIFKKMKLMHAGVVYTLCTLLFISLVSALYFKEPLSLGEKIGILLAFSSILMLYKFA